MKKILTQEKLVLFVYGEISDPKERAKIEKEIHSSSEWTQLYTELMEARQMLDHNNSVPSDDVIKKIMDYSKSLGPPKKRADKSHK
jgi:hypothetical protein